MASAWATLTVDSHPMKTYVAVPEGQGPFPAVVVAQHAAGADRFIQSICDRLAEAGYAAAAPDLYHRLERDISLEEILSLKRDDPRWGEVIWPLAGATLDEEIVRDMNAAMDHLSSLAQVDGRMVGVAGFCGGGRVAYLMATRNARLRAAACFYPASLFQSKGGGPSPFAASDRILCPVMGFFGKDDVNPSPDDMDRVEAELSRLRVEHELHAYNGAAHSFMDPTNPGAYREQAATDAWGKLMGFFNDKLKAGVGAER